MTVQVGYIPGTLAQDRILAASLYGMQAFTVGFKKISINYYVDQVPSITDYQTSVGLISGSSFAMITPGGANNIWLKRCVIQSSVAGQVNIQAGVVNRFVINLLANTPYDLPLPTDGLLIVTGGTILNLLNNTGAPSTFNVTSMYIVTT